jgi:hypothetical protein
MFTLLAATLGVGGVVSSAGASPGVGLRTLQFSGYTWQVKASSGPVGPGPNYFSDSDENVWVDSLGRLHLKLTYANGRWYAAEVINTQSLGLGRYTFDLDSPVDMLDPNVVLGLFTWSDDPAFNNRELDIEFSRWGDAADLSNGRYVVQPYDRSGNIQRIVQRPAPSSVQSFDWQASNVTFASSTAAPSSWTYTGPDVPQPASAHVRLNLWLDHGAPPLNGNTVEVVVRRFTFEPDG